MGKIEEQNSQYTAISLKPIHFIDNLKLGNFVPLPEFFTTSITIMYKHKDIEVFSNNTLIKVDAVAMKKTKTRDSIISF